MTPGTRASWAGCAAAVALGGVLRLVSCWNDLWLDEVWSWAAAGRLDSWSGVFTDIHHSNNNHLNTWILYAFGQDAPGFTYRLPAWLAGTASIALAANLAWRRGRLEAVLAAVLFAGCFTLVHFSSEARGYALAVFCALLALRALGADLDDQRRWGAPVFATAVSLGLLAHLVFAFFWAGAIAHSALRLARNKTGAARIAWRLTRLHGAPLLCLALLWLVDLRHMQVGSGNPTDFAWVSSRLFGFAFGLPVTRALAWPYALAALLGLGLAMLRLRRRGDDAWVLYGVAIAAAPLGVIGTLQPDVIAVRYFLIGVALSLLIASDVLADLLRAGGVRRVVALGLVGAYLIGNGVHTAAFLEHGRGGYAAALRHMADRSPGPEIVVASDHDFRNGLVLRFHARALPPDRRLVYRGREQAGRAGPAPEWRIVHAAHRPETAPARIRDPAGRRYALSAEFDHAAISGFYWAVYRLDAASSAPRRSNTIPKR